MDTQSNQSQELDSQEQLAQEYASREQDYGKRRKSSKRGEGPGFGMGIAAGMSIMLLLVLLVMTGSQFLLNQGKKAAAKQNTAQKAPAKQALSEKGVEKKAGELADLIDQYYYKDIDQKSLVEGMYAGMVEGLDDPYSSYFTAEEYASFNESTTGIYYGIGTVLTQNMDTKIVKILHVYPGTPAEEAGIRDGDVIVKVEDIEADSVELSELTSHIKGEEGTKVHLELMRAGESEHLQIDVERRQIEVPTVEYQMLEGNVGLIQITEFSTATPEQFDHAVKDLQGKGMASMIVDLRNNPGGVLQSVCTMLDEILPEGC